MQNYVETLLHFLHKCIPFSKPMKLTAHYMQACDQLHAYIFLCLHHDCSCQCIHLLAHKLVHGTHMQVVIYYSFSSQPKVNKRDTIIIGVTISS